MNIAIVRDVKSPERGTDYAAGIDFFVPNDFEPISLNPNQDVLIPSGIHADIPTGFALIAMNKSGVATKRKLIVGAEVCDEDYQGELHIHVINTGMDIVTIGPGEKIVQFVLLPVSYVKPNIVDIKDLFGDTTQRGTGGFGSTGTK